MKRTFLVFISCMILGFVVVSCKTTKGTVEGHSAVIEGENSVIYSENPGFEKGDSKVENLIFNLKPCFQTESKVFFLKRNTESHSCFKTFVRKTALLLIQFAVVIIFTFCEQNKISFNHRIYREPFRNDKIIF